MFKVFTRKKINKLIRLRVGETKWGEKVRVAAKKRAVEELINESKASFVLFGIPEDIGVLGNMGRPGSRYAWKHALAALLNTQCQFTRKAQRVLVLGAFNFKNEYARLENVDLKSKAAMGKLRQITAEIDKEVTHLVSIIVKAGKKPIAIGGGHNNAYGLIKGTALGLGRAINVINLDAHSDFRALEGRHSGNAFSYVFDEGFLYKYFVFGLQPYYNSKSILNIFNKQNRLDYRQLEDVQTGNPKDFDEAVRSATVFLRGHALGLELDCDSMALVDSSAVSSYGFSVAEARRFLKSVCTIKKPAYLHICEAAPDEKKANEAQIIGKLIATLIRDFTET